MSSPERANCSTLPLLCNASRLKRIVCSCCITETKDNPNFAVIGSLLDEFARKLNSFQLPCFASEFAYNRKEQRKFQSLTKSLKISLNWKPALIHWCSVISSDRKGKYDMQSNHQIYFELMLISGSV